MRSPDLEPVDVLVGEWSLVVTDAWFLESRDVRQHGHAVVRWIGDAFIKFHAEMEGEPEDPDFHQRFVATVADDTIHGRWDASEDAGATWRKDFDLNFERIRP